MNSTEQPKNAAKVRFYPSGMTEVSGADPDQVALIGAAIAKGIYGPRPLQKAPDEVLSVNGATTDLQLPLPDPPVRAIPREPQEHGPFVDRSVTNFHPAILALEQHVLSAPTGATFQLRELRTFVGHQITGVWRECQTRSVGTLMSRLTDAGFVSRVGEGKWQKLARVA
jgi:hypothetical protein